MKGFFKSVIRKVGEVQANNQSKAIFRSRADSSFITSLDSNGVNLKAITLYRAPTNSLLAASPQEPDVPFLPCSSMCLMMPVCVIFCFATKSGYRTSTTYMSTFIILFIYLRIFIFEQEQM